MSDLLAGGAASAVGVCLEGIAVGDGCSILLSTSPVFHNKSRVTVPTRITMLMTHS